MKLILMISGTDVITSEFDKIVNAVKSNTSITPVDEIFIHGTGRLNSSFVNALRYAFPHAEFVFRSDFSPRGRTFNDVSWNDIVINDVASFQVPQRFVAVAYNAFLQTAFYAIGHSEGFVAHARALRRRVDDYDVLSFKII